VGLSEGEAEVKAMQGKTEEGHVQPALEDIKCRGIELRDLHPLDGLKEVTPGRKIGTIMIFRTTLFVVVGAFYWTFRWGCTDGIGFALKWGTAATEPHGGFCWVFCETFESLGKASVMYFLVNILFNLIFTLTHGGVVGFLRNEVVDRWLEVNEHNELKEQMLSEADADHIAQTPSIKGAAEATELRKSLEAASLKDSYDCDCTSEVAKAAECATCVVAKRRQALRDIPIVGRLSEHEDPRFSIIRLTSILVACTFTWTSIWCCAGAEHAGWGRWLNDGYCEYYNDYVLESICKAGVLFMILNILINFVWASVNGKLLWYARVFVMNTALGTQEETAFLLEHD